MLTRTAVGLITLLATTAVANAQERILGATYGWPEAPELWAIDPDTAEATLVADLDYGINGMATNEDGDLLIVQADTIYRVHPHTGERTFVAQATDNFGNRGMAYRLSDGALFYIEDGGDWDDVLGYVDPTTMNPTTVGDTGFDSLQSLAIGPDETLYSWDMHDGLVILDPDTGAGTEVAGENFGVGSIQYLTFRFGELYGGRSKLYQIDLLTGFPLLIGTHSNEVDDLRGAELREIGEPYCTANVNSSGQAAITRASGSTRVEYNDVTLVAMQLPLFQFGYFLVSQSEGFVPNVGGSQGNLCLGAPIARYVQQLQNSGPQGRFSITIDLNDMPPPVKTQVFPGDTYYFQAWFRDMNPGPTSNLTDGLAITFK